MKKGALVAKINSCSRVPFVGRVYNNEKLINEEYKKTLICPIASL